MTRDEHRQVINRLLGMVAADHQADASELLTNLSDDYEKTLTASESSATRITELEENNANLLKVNSKLFLRVGETEKQVTHSEEPDKGEPEVKPLPFADLFNEKGELI